MRGATSRVVAATAAVVVVVVLIACYVCPLRFRALRPDDLGPKQLPVLQEENEDDDDNEEEEMEMLVVRAPEEKWDCESIISEYHVAPFTGGGSSSSTTTFLSH